MLAEIRLPVGTAPSLVSASKPNNQPCSPTTCQPGQLFLPPCLVFSSPALQWICICTAGDCRDCHVTELVLRIPCFKMWDWKCSESTPPNQGFSQGSQIYPMKKLKCCFHFIKTHCTLVVCILLYNFWACTCEYNHACTGQRKSARAVRKRFPRNLNRLKSRKGRQTSWHSTRRPILTSACIRALSSTIKVKYNISSGFLTRHSSAGRKQ